MLVAIDTSTSQASVALVDHGVTLAELNWEVGQRHSTELFARLTWLLQSRDIPMTALDGIAVAVGPGSFNGLRVAVTTAKSLAFALDVRSEEHTSELQSQSNLVCRLLLEHKKNTDI